MEGILRQQLPKAKYIVAVSGGVDSVALLHMLNSLIEPDYEFVVAHFDHGIRIDSSKDRLFVQDLADNYNLDFVYKEAGLGPNRTKTVTSKSCTTRTVLHFADMTTIAISNLM